MAKIACSLERAHQNRAGAIDLAGAVVAPEGVNDEGSLQVLLDAQCTTTNSALIQNCILALSEGDRREVLLPLTCFV